MTEEEMEEMRVFSNAWIKIPEFRVHPKDVGFAGFLYPVFGPNMDCLTAWYLASLIGYRYEHVPTFPR